MREHKFTAYKHKKLSKKRKERSLGTPHDLITLQVEHLRNLSKHFFPAFRLPFGEFFVPLQPIIINKVYNKSK